MEHWVRQKVLILKCTKIVWNKKQWTKFHCFFVLNEKLKNKKALKN